LIQIPPNPGAYALQLLVNEPVRLDIGRIRSAYFPCGEYVYLGSACGPGGLQARLGRHLSGKIARLHWHIDYLRPFARLHACCYLEIDPSALGTTPAECLWSQALLNLPFASVPIRGFGSSDCHSGCRAHLVAFGGGAPLFGTKSFLGALSQAVGRSMNDLICEKFA
jgi:Uri superfamily endonuclease